MRHTRPVLLSTIAWRDPIAAPKSKVAILSSARLEPSSVNIGLLFHPGLFSASLFASLSARLLAKSGCGEPLIIIPSPLDCAAVCCRASVGLRSSFPFQPKDCSN